MKTFMKGIIGSVLFTVASSVAAFPVNLESVGGQWADPQGGDNVSILSSGGSSFISWGHNTGQGKSGYLFNPSATLPTTINGPDEFVLGTMTHKNKPINGNAIASVSLHIMAEFSGFGEAFDTGPHTFAFSHIETPNNASNPYRVCFLWWCWNKDRYDGDIDDTVYLDDVITSGEFQLGSNVYSLSLLGIEGHLSQFATAEREDTSVNLVARLNVRSVPEPGTLALLGLGLAGLALARRRNI